MTTPGDIHQLLPFYVNGTLSEAEKALVEQALKDNPALQEEIDFLSALRSTMKELPEESSPGEFGLKRLQRAMQRGGIEDDPIARARSKIAPEQNRVWRAVAVAACLVLMLQTAFMFNSQYQSNGLTAASGPAISALSVTFAPDATEADIRILLLSLNLSIVDGPSALGVYHLTTDYDIEKVLGVLQSQTALVETVQRDTP